MVVLEDGREQARIISNQLSVVSDQSAPVPPVATVTTVAVMGEPEKEHDGKAEINHPPGKPAGRRAKVA
jgi:hypothetical protein